MNFLLVFCTSNPYKPKHCSLLSLYILHDVFMTLAALSCLEFLNTENKYQSKQYFCERRFKYCFNQTQSQGQQFSFNQSYDNKYK